MAVVPLAATALDVVEHRVVVLTVHAVDGVHLAEQRRADLQGGEMQGHEDHPLALRLGLAQMLQAFYMGKTGQARLRPPPAHGHLEEGDAAGGEVLLQQTLAFGGRLFRKAQFEVARGNLAARANQAVHQRPQATAEHQQDGIRQLHHQPEQPQAEPERPVAGMEESAGETGAIHGRFRRRSKPAILPCPPSRRDAALPIDAAPAICHACGHPAFSL